MRRDAMRLKKLGSRYKQGVFTYRAARRDAIKKVKDRSTFAACRAGHKNKLSDQRRLLKHTMDLATCRDLYRQIQSTIPTVL